MSGITGVDLRTLDAGVDKKRTEPGATTMPTTKDRGTYWAESDAAWLQTYSQNKDLQRLRGALAIRLGPEVADEAMKICFMSGYVESRLNSEWAKLGGRKQ